MRNRKPHTIFYILLCIVLSFSFVFTPRAWACSCVMSTQESSQKIFDKAGMVFIGEVIDHRSEINQEDFLQSADVIQIRILELYKGDTTLKTVTAYYTPSYISIDGHHKGVGTNCKNAYRKEGLYRFILYAQDDGSYKIENSCHQFSYDFWRALAPY